MNHVLCDRPLSSKNIGCTLNHIPATCKKCSSRNQGRAHKKPANKLSSHMVNVLHIFLPIINRVPRRSLGVISIRNNRCAIKTPTILRRGTKGPRFLVLTRMFIMYVTVYTKMTGGKQQTT